MAPHPRARPDRAAFAGDPACARTDLGTALLTRSSPARRQRRARFKGPKGSRVLVLAWGARLTDARQLRSVAPLDLPYHLKLALAVQTTSALRTISPYSVFNGPRLAAAAKAIAPPALDVVDEVATAGLRHPDPNVAKYAPPPQKKRRVTAGGRRGRQLTHAGSAPHPRLGLRRHCACIVRQDPERLRPDQHVIMCGALVESNSAGEPHVRALLGLDTRDTCSAFLDRCVRARVRARAWAYLSLAPDKNKLTTSPGDVTWWWGGNRQVCWPTFGRGGASDARPRLRLGGPWAKYAGAL